MDAASSGRLREDAAGGGWEKGAARSGAGASVGETGRDAGGGGAGGKSGCVEEGEEWVEEGLKHYDYDADDWSGSLESGMSEAAALELLQGGLHPPSGAAGAGAGARAGGGPAGGNTGIDFSRQAAGDGGGEGPLKRCCAGRDASGSEECRAGGGGTVGGLKAGEEALGAGSVGHDESEEEPYYASLLERRCKRDGHRALEVPYQCRRRKLVCVCVCVCVCVLLVWHEPVRARVRACSCLACVQRCGCTGNRFVGQFVIH